MIFSTNKKPPISVFQNIMKTTDCLLNEDALHREDYYTKRSGKAVEQDVYRAVNEAAKGTDFEGTIKLVSGASFPDIVASKFYGIEVKSTEKNHWTSIGSSILESTRNQNVERIYLTFGKLGKPVKFLSRPYEECLSGIAVTHYPRYQIDMRLKEGETIFDKMGIPYDELRLMKNPVEPVSEYYKKRLKPGESLWWTSNNADTSSPATIKLWTSLSPQRKNMLIAQAYAMFPEILGNSNNKYNRCALWLVTSKSIVNTNIRDSFSAGGRVALPNKNGIFIKVPKSFGHINEHRYLIQATIESSDEQLLREYWKVNKISNNRMSQWCHLISCFADKSIGYATAWDILSVIFPCI